MRVVYDQENQTKKASPSSRKDLLGSSLVRGFLRSSRPERRLPMTAGAYTVEKGLFRSSGGSGSS